MATLKDVAREAGLTVGTVSRVLNNRGYISEQTRQKVYQVMKELNYQPNEMARSLSTQKSRVIAVIVPHSVHPYFAKLISNLESTAFDYGYKILLLNSKGKEEREDLCVEMCMSSRVAGVIVCSGTVNTDKFLTLDCPVVTVERSIGGQTAGIECDNYSGGVLATEHLYERGARYLLHITGITEPNMPANRRQDGFEDVCRKYRIPYRIVTPDRRDYNDLEYYKLIEQALDAYPEIDGIFASSDVIAAQAIQTCARRNIRVPEDMKIVGFDDVVVSALTIPRITTIRQPIHEMAVAAIEAAIQRAEGKHAPTQTMFPVSLIVREST